MHGFVGRSSELAELRARLVAARGGVPQIVEIQGPPGIGKTALLSRFLADPGDGVPPVVLRSSGEETEVLLAYGVIDQLARSAGRAGDSLLLPAGSPGTAVDDAVTVGSRLLQLLGGVEGDAPVLLVVDDVHWVDQPSLKALVFALRRLVAEPVVVLLAVRDTEAASSTAVPGDPAGSRRLSPAGPADLASWSMTP